MKFETVKQLDDEKFRRLSGVKRSTCNRMVLILDLSNREKSSRGKKKQVKYRKYAPNDS